VAGPALAFESLDGAVVQAFGELELAQRFGDLAVFVIQPKALPDAFHHGSD
jgi:hypothetical protein